jgi:23S rRNA (cytosine1962-C5)-methyltransferase
MQIEPNLIRALGKREKLFGDTETNCFRILNGEGDGVPGLVIDWYGEYILIQYYDQRLRDSTGDIIRAVTGAADRFPAPPRGILLKNRVKSADTRDISAAMKSVILEGSEPPEGYSVRQNGILAGVDLMRGQSTGIFLDMREIRDRLVRYYTHGDIMLNLFSYTALFSVHALMHGITGAVNVDLSKAVLERARANYRRNGLRVDERDFVYGDSLDWIRRFRKKERTFTVAVFDPPTFSRNRRRTFSSKKNYQDSLAMLSDIVKGGHVFTSVNSYSISREEYMSYHPAEWRLEFFANESADFAHSGNPYLKAGLWKIKNS